MLSKKLSTLYFFKSSFDVYTDGSLKHGHGSWAFVIVRRGKVLYESTGTAKHTTNNRMEFQAAIEALIYLPLKKQIILYTDSRVLLEAIVKIAEWKELGWKKRDGSPIPSVDQMQQLSELIKNRKIEWRWVKSHSGAVFNERCDQLCLQARS